MLGIRSYTILTSDFQTADGVLYVLENYPHAQGLRTHKFLEARMAAHQNFE